jgi:NAD(P)-dependent dehydrogenase (short-subunit alcohol dehydrogenase family)
MATAPSFFRDKVCVVTGTSRGIGLALTRALVEAGADVFAGCRQPASAKALQDLVPAAGGRLHVLPLDVAKDASVATFAAALPQAVDVLFNNAGVNLPNDGAPADLSPATLMETLDVNTVGPLRVTNACLQRLRQAKAPRVANISSVMGSIGENGMGGVTAYRVSKTALNMLTKNFALHEREVTFLAMHPGWVQTDMGGKERAPVPVTDSARGLLQVVAEATTAQSGTFVRFDGKTPAY